jgi:hypothetical protein
MADTALPRYSASASVPPFEDVQVSTGLLPPSYTPPTQFRIGNSTTPKPLVGIPEVKGHLALLHAFAELKTQVNAIPTSSSFFSNGSSYPDAKWAWFVGLAAERLVSC